MKQYETKDNASSLLIMQS